MSPHEPPTPTASRSIAGSVALITGAASGMGRATATLFADAGARLILCDLQAEALESVSSTLRAAGADVANWTLDLSDGAAIQRMVSEAEQRFGGIDIVVNNAGVSLPTAIDGPELEERWARSHEVLLRAPMRVIRAALPALRRAEHPRIVNVASTEGLGATGGGSPYTSAKHGLIGLTRSLAVELGREGITVNCVCPGPINTAMTAEIPEEAKATYARRRTALRRYGEPEEVAHAILSLVLPASSFITGVALPVDGGLTIRRA